MLLRDAAFLRSIYHWLAGLANRPNHLASDVSRQGILASSLAKLGVAGQLEAGDLKLIPSRQGTSFGSSDRL